MKGQLELGRLRGCVCSEAGEIFVCLGDERILSGNGDIAMDFEEWLERWAGAEVKHDWCLAQLSWRPEYVQGSRREKLTSCDAMDPNPSIVFPTFPIILGFLEMKNSIIAV